MNTVSPPRPDTDSATSRPLEHVLALLSHEFRQPLSAIAAALEVQKRSLSPERRQRAIEVVEQHVRHLSRMVEDLAGMAASASGLTLRREKIDAQSVLREAIDMIDPEQQPWAHVVTVVAPAAPVWLFADRTRLVQVLGNLLKNAATYTPEGGRIAVTLRVSEGMARLQIADEGTGIEAGSLSRIFDLFERGTQHVHHQGSGIGLALARGFVEQHGGHIEARSDGVGRGSEFVVLLPIME